MQVTIKDIAKKTGVSYATVSRALNGRSGVKEDTRELILEVARKMGYQPNAIARGLVLKHTHTLALVIPDITNPFFPEIARGVEDAASLLGYSVFLCNTNWEANKEKLYLKTLQEKRVDGIILHPSHDVQDNHFLDFQVPVVLLNKIPNVVEYSSIEVDNVMGGFIATKHLIEAGYKKIAFIGGSENSPSNAERKEGYKLALRKYKLPIDESLILSGKFNSESGYHNLKKLIYSGNTPDAVFGGNDVIALGVLHCAQEHGLRIPEDFGIIGFDDIPYASLPQIQLTTIEQPKYQMGRHAIELLMRAIKEEKADEVKRIILEPKLKARKTTREVPNNKAIKY
ncbi:MAG: LacI family transcriptional regulator [Clostridiaceae bacterium]|nr:LacI family transcriptional regulator [Clostridiaceae bacterium]